MGRAALPRGLDERQLVLTLAMKTLRGSATDGKGRKDRRAAPAEEE